MEARGACPDDEIVWEVRYNELIANGSMEWIRSDSKDFHTDLLEGLEGVPSIHWDENYLGIGVLGNSHYAERNDGYLGVRAYQNGKLLTEVGIEFFF